MEKIRVGFVGAGYMGQRAHIASYATLPDVELTAFAEARGETAKAVAQWKQSKEFGSLNYLRVTMPPGDRILAMDPPINMKDKASYDNEKPERSPGWMTDEQAKVYMDFINYYIH